MRPGKRDDGSVYWQYVLLYTDTILAIMEEPEEFIRKELASYFTIKEKSIEPPTQYLGNITSYNGGLCQVLEFQFVSVCSRSGKECRRLFI